MEELELIFSIVHSSDYTFQIKSRDWQGIIEEVQKYQTFAFEEAAKELNKQLKNGYISGCGKL